MFTLFLTKIAIGAIGLFILFTAMFLMLRVFDLIGGVKFKQVLDTLHTDSKALAIYFGLRWLGCSIAVGLVVCIAFIL